MRNLAVITARGGSKRIPRKNIRKFCGKPILAYVIEAALKSKLFTEVIVSTEDEEIAAAAREWGAAVPFMRSQKNADDYASTADVLLEVIKKYQEKGANFTWLCCLYPTAPFVTAEKLQASMQRLQENKADALLPVVKYSYPPQRSFVIQKERLQYKWPQYIDSRSQDLESMYHDAGQFYFIKPELLLREKSLVPHHTIAYRVEEVEVQDIDEESDWKLAEIKYRYIQEQRRSNER